MKNIWMILRSLLVLHRIETIFFVVPLATWGPLIAMGAGGSNLKLVLLAIALNIGTAYNGLFGNSYCDYELDKNAGSKRGMTDAMDLIGRQKVLFLFLVETAALVGTFYAFYDEYATEYAALWFWLGMAGRYLYNFPPFRLKERGIWNMVTYAINFGVTPFLLAWSIFFDTFPIALWLLAMAGFLLMASQSLWGAAVDYDSDKASNAETVAVNLGLKRSLYLSQWLMACAVPLVLFSVLTLTAGPVTHPLVVATGLLTILLGFTYSIADRQTYVVGAEDDLTRERLAEKFRQLRWLVAQTLFGLAGIVMVIVGKAAI